MRIGYFTVKNHKIIEQPFQSWRYQLKMDRELSKKSINLEIRVSGNIMTKCSRKAQLACYPKAKKLRNSS